MQAYRNKLEKVQEHLSTMHQYYCTHRKRAASGTAVTSKPGVCSLECFVNVKDNAATIKQSKLRLNHSCLQKGAKQCGVIAINFDRLSIELWSLHIVCLAFKAMCVVAVARPVCGIADKSPPLVGSFVLVF